MRLFPPLVALVVCVAAAPARAVGDAGASTFESGGRLYRREPLRDRDIAVPKVVPKPPPPAPGTADELTFRIHEFQVSGSTLLTPSEIDALVAPYRGENKKLADVYAARDALQKAYDETGLVGVVVTVPKQTVEAGTVKLEVIEARIGKVTVANEGWRWFSDESVLEKMPSLHPGAMPTQDELERDVARANRHPDRRVRPVQSSGDEPGTYDVRLVVDDRIPAHGSVRLTNDHGPGAPEWQIVNRLSYTNLWGLEHEASIAWQTAPFGGFDDVQVFSGSYRAPMPWSERQTLVAFAADSDTTSRPPQTFGILAKSESVDVGVRYDIDLPVAKRFEGFSHGLGFQVDYKDYSQVPIFFGEPVESLKTPVKYLPIRVDYTATAYNAHVFGTATVGYTINREGVFDSGTTESFQRARGGLRGDNPVTGNYELATLRMQSIVRVPSLLRTLAAGEFVKLPEPASGFAGDWTLQVTGRGQYASEPLITPETFTAGGVDSVRGYLQGEAYGDSGWNAQFELRSPSWQHFLGGRLGETLQLVAFYDAAQLFVLDPPITRVPDYAIQGAGLGFRAGLFGHLSTEIFAAIPRTRAIGNADLGPLFPAPTLAAGSIRFHILVSADF